MGDAIPIKADRWARVTIFWHVFSLAIVLTSVVQGFVASWMLSAIARAAGTGGGNRTPAGADGWDGAEVSPEPLSAPIANLPLAIGPMG